jgi:hypothetical protein
MHALRRSIDEEDGESRGEEWLISKWRSPGYIEGNSRGEKTDKGGGVIGKIPVLLFWEFFQYINIKKTNPGFQNSSNIYIYSDGE